MKRKLVLAELNCYYSPNCDIPLSLLYSNRNKYDYVIAENFIDTVVFNDEFSRNINFVNLNRYLEYECFLYSTLSIDILKKINRDAIDIFKSVICDTFYISLICDTYFIGNYKTYHQSHVEHQMFIFGFDDDAQCFYARDYFDFNKPTYCTISYIDIVDMINNYAIPNFKGYHYLDNYYTLEIIKLNTESFRSINTEKIKLSLYNFVNSIQLMTYKNQSFGIQSFRIIVDRIVNDKMINTKHLHFIKVHIFYMQQRFEIVQNLLNNYPFTLYLELYNKFSELIKFITLLENKVLKYRVSNKSISFEKVTEQLDKLICDYEKIIRNLIEYL